MPSRLYLSDPARTYASVARDLGINRETLRLWVKEARADGTAGAKKAGPAKKPASGPISSDDVLEEENKQLRARVRELELELERDILRLWGLRTRITFSAESFVRWAEGLRGAEWLVRVAWDHVA
jgi:transposase